MYHVRSRTGAEQRYRTQTARAWRSLFLCAGGCVGGLALALVAPVQRQGGLHGAPAPLVAEWEPETEAAPLPNRCVLALPPPPVVEFATPAVPAVPPAPAESPAFPQAPLPLAAETPPLFPAPDSLGDSPRPPRKTQAAPPVPAPAAAQNLAEVTPPAYRENPEPPYPPSMRAERTEGSVRVRIAINAGGTPTRVDILQSSGHREFDLTARDWILRRWLFSPARCNGKPIAGAVSTSIRFVLD